MLWLSLFLYWFNSWIDRYFNCFIFSCPLLMLPSVFFREVASPVFALTDLDVWMTFTVTVTLLSFWHGGIGHLGCQVSCFIVYTVFPSHAKSRFPSGLLLECVWVGVSDQGPISFIHIPSKTGFPRVLLICHYPVAKGSRFKKKSVHLHIFNEKYEKNMKIYEKIWKNIKKYKKI